MRFARWTLIASTLAISVFTTGCGSSTDSNGSKSSTNALSATEVAARYGYDVATATMTPSFALIPEYKDPRDGYARQLLARECLRGVYDYLAVPPTANAATDAIDPRTLQRNFTAQIAAQWGYQLPPSAPAGGTGQAATVTPEIQAQMVQCGKKTEERLGTPPQKPINTIEDAGWAAVDADARVKAAAVKWRTCMAPAGVIDLPANPHDMPSPSVVTPGSRTTDAQGNQVSAGNVAASAREKQVAVLDVQCRTQAGFDSAELHARAQVELTAIGLDIQGFESARQKYQEYNKGVEQVIEELGG